MLLTSRRTLSNFSACDLRLVTWLAADAGAEEYESLDLRTTEPPNTRRTPDKL
jgi:hypothetical protein